MNCIELFEKIKESATFGDILKTIKDTQSKRGNVFEKMWDMVIKFGFCPLLSNEEYDHYDGNISDCNMKKITDLELYYKKKLVLSNGEGGASDITLRHKITGKWIFISSKFRLDDDNHNVDEFDVSKIHTILLKSPNYYKKYEIYLFVNDKQKVEKKIKKSHSTNKKIAEDMNNILDLTDLEFYYQHLKSAIQSIPFDEINAHFGTPKNPLELRFHQDLITHRQMTKIEEGETQLLLGAKARSGKTYCVGGLFNKYYKKYGHINALIITPAPTETITQFTNDLFHKFRDFNDINIVEINRGSDFDGGMDLRTNNIIIVSKQLLDGFVGTKKVEAIQRLALNFIVFDENHFHGTTEMSKNILLSYSANSPQKTVMVFLTATFAKPLNEWNIPTECQFYWDIEDEQMCKNRNIAGLTEKHGEDVGLFVNETNKERILTPYDKMPDLHLFTNMMDGERYQEIKERIKDTSYGFSNGTLLSGGYSGQVDMILGYITGSNKERDYPKKDMSIFGRIKRHSATSGSRTLLNNGDFTTQLWFLPFGIGMTIDSVSKHLKDRMGKNTILARYEIQIVNTKNNKETKLKEIKDEIHNWEINAKKDGKDGLIILAGNQLTLGITLPLVDIVFLFNDIVSSDKIIQMMYRCMTERIESPEMDEINDKPKKMGFVVDLNISRVLNTCLDYSTHKHNVSPEGKIKYLVENNLMNIDADLFQGKENKTKLVEKLLQIWKGDPVNNLTRLLRKIEENAVELDDEDQTTMNRTFTGCSTKDKNGIPKNVRMDEENDQPLPTGKEVTAPPPTNGNGGEDDDDDTTPDVNVSLTKDILPFVIPLICILTMNTNNNDIMVMMDTIKNTPTLLEVFQDQSFIWWNKKDTIKLMERIINKYIKKDTSIYSIAIQFKMSLQELIDRPKELLELIDSCLKPKQKEKQENGEVFTPMYLVFEMLNELDKHYTQENGKSIFAEKEFKWFDPASGMGNFPVAVYLKLMEGLTTQIPDEKERKNHILEQMLYMSELNKKNVFICRQIFNANDRHNLNLYEGDTLLLDVMDEWGIGVNGFDVVMGNPPYNKGNIRAAQKDQSGIKSETIWNKFVDKTFKLWLKSNGHLVFINPLSWLKKSHPLHMEILEKHIIWLKLWDYMKSLTSINGKIPISLYILQNIQNINSKKTNVTSEIQSRKFYTKTTEYLNPIYSIPLAFHSIFNKLNQFIETNNLQLEYKTKTVKSSGIKTKMPIEHTLENMLAVDTYTVKEGILVKTAIEQHPDANKRKIIISNKASFTGAFIDEGKLSLTGNHKFYILGENLELIQKMFGFKIINIIQNCCKYAQEYLENVAFYYIPDIRKLGITDITEDEFYRLVGFTHHEIAQIKNPSLNIEPSIVEPVELIVSPVVEIPQIKTVKRTAPKKRLVIIG
jgi:hypothetical protein